MAGKIDPNATYVATERLYFDGVLAHDVGHEVPAANIEPNGWGDKVAKAGTRAAETATEAPPEPGKP